MDHDPQVDNGMSSESPVFGPSSSKRHRMNGPEPCESPYQTSAASPNNNNDSHLGQWSLGGHERRGSADLIEPNGAHRGLPKSSGESLLSQALEKNPGLLRSSLSVGLDVGGSSGDGRGDDSGASDTTSDRPESLMDGLVKSSDGDPMQLHSPASSSANPLFPPGLEALYRQAGFPSAFLGLAAGATGGNHSVSASGAGGTIPGFTSSVPQVGLQSHAGNPNRE